ncbi:MAG: 30S ribosomal protein S27e [Candidatus Pacearchaeota archaeon]|nr:30S ribosomal protein S27e [Candidatus Pacearchaeota archaeon]
MAESRFLELKCPRCSNPQITYYKATIKVKCTECNKLLIKPTGGKAKIKAQIKNII